MAKSNLTDGDERAVVHAVAATFNSLFEGYARKGMESLSAENVKALLYYHINPWCTDSSFDMLGAICEQLEEQHGNE